jgi:hypothetical protein
MALLSDDLLNVLTNFEGSSNVRSGDSNHGVYQSVIVAHSDIINSISREAASCSSEGRASLLCKACRLLFGNETITSEDPGYAFKKQQNW